MTKPHDDSCSNPECTLTHEVAARKPFNAHYERMAKDIVKAQQKQYGAGLNLVSRDIQRAMAVERAAMNVLGWSVKGVEEGGTATMADVHQLFRAVYAQFREE